METNAPEQSVDNPRLRGRTDKILRNIIFTREILPDQKVIQEAPVREIGAGRDSIRGKLFRLEYECIVKTFPHRNVMVVKPSGDNITKILKIRETLSTLRIRRITPLADAGDGRCGRVSETLRLKDRRPCPEGCRKHR